MLLRFIFFFLSCTVIWSAEAKLRDPTQPLEYNHQQQEDSSDKSELEIQGLFVSKSKRIALINEQFYAVGDETSQGKLVAVFKDRVVVLQGKAMKVIFMIKQKVRKD